MLSLMLLLAATGALATGHLPLERRAPQSDAICLSSFTWLDNSAHVSPCQLAAVVASACAGNSWTVHPINLTTQYQSPNAQNGTLNGCYCSWAGYNLFQACASCQGFESSSVSWPEWRLNCGAFTTNDTYFPSALHLADGTLIPYYATTDPTTWTDDRFNIQQAREKYQEAHADLNPSAKPIKQSSPVGAIVGGVIGGLVVLILAALAAFFIHRKKKNQAVYPPPMSTTNSTLNTLGYASPPTHGRNLSGTSQKSLGYGYPAVAGSFVTSFTNSNTTRGPASPGPTTMMHSPTGSVHSLSYFGSVNNAVAPYTSPSSPPPRSIATTASPPPILRPEDREHVITPFTLVHTQPQASTSNLADRKRADGAIVIPVYDSPDSLPNQPDAPSSRGRRINPPAYTDYTADRPVEVAPPSRPMHSKKGSADTVPALDSTRGGNMNITHGTGGGGGGSISDDVIGQMGLGTETVSETNGTLATGQSVQMARNAAFRPRNPAL